MIGVDKSTVYRWEAGKQAPESGAAVSLAEALGTTSDYLLGKTPAPEKWSQGPSPEAGESMIKTDGCGMPDMMPFKPEYFSGNSICIPVYEDAYAACAGHGNHLEGVEPTIAEWKIVDVRQIGPVSSDPELAPFGIKVDGDSMEAAGISNGSFALVNPGIDWVSGDAVLVRIGDICAIKWVECRPEGTLVFYSASGTYPPRSFSRMEQAEKGVRVIGAVVDVWNRPKRMR